MVCRDLLKNINIWDVSSFSVQKMNFVFHFVFQLESIIFVIQELELLGTLIGILDEILLGSRT